MLSTPAAALSSAVAVQPSVHPAMATPVAALTAFDKTRPYGNPRKVVGTWFNNNVMMYL